MTPEQPLDEQEGQLSRLTAREAEVLGLLSAGRSVPEVAAGLQISPRTVDKHLEHIRHKLGVQTSRAAVIRWLTD